MERLFQSDEKVTRAPGGEQGAIAWFRDELALLAGELLRSLGSLAELAPSYVEESLNALEKRNEPHRDCYLPSSNCTPIFRRT